MADQLESKVMDLPPPTSPIVMKILGLGIYTRQLDVFSPEKGRYNLWVVTEKHIQFQSYTIMIFGKW
jgi:hypothetical protein